MIKEIKSALKQGGYLITIYNKLQLQQITILIEQVFRPLGFELEKFTRLPYLCEGNLSQSFYYLIDYLFALKSVWIFFLLKVMINSNSNPKMMNNKIFKNHLFVKLN